MNRDQLETHCGDSGVRLVEPEKDAWLNPRFLQCDVCGALLRDDEAAKKHCLWHVGVKAVEPKLGNWDTV